MKYTYRIFFKKTSDSAKAKSCKQIELPANNFKSASKMAHNIASKEKLRVVMVAELPQ
jgi:hypothetical protein